MSVKEKEIQNLKINFDFVCVRYPIEIFNIVDLNVPKIKRIKK